MDEANLELLSKDELIEMLRERSEAGVRLNFPGKAVSRRIARKVRPRLQRHIEKYSYGTSAQQARNALIEGDNLQALVTLYKERGQVDLILTDPPYNTGNDFRYNDKWDQDPNDPGIGDLVVGEDMARHTKWMKFMYPRLQMMQSMLSPTGVLAICIDRREMFHLGQMLDELFGEHNRLGIISWQRTYSKQNDSGHLAAMTEYVLVYAKDAERAKTRLLPIIRDGDAESNLDKDPQAWTDGPATASNARAHKSMVYGIQSPFTGEVHYPPRGSAWRNEQAWIIDQLRGWGVEYKLEKLDDVERRASHIGITEGATPAVQAVLLAEPIETAREKALTVLKNGTWPEFYFLRGGEGKPRIKRPLSKMRQGEVASTFWATDNLQWGEDISWPHEISGHSEQGVKELTAVVGDGHDFKTVKPLKLFEKIIRLWCPDDGLVLDPFAGSGTSGHAVLDLNQVDDADRRFILIEQGRQDRGDSYARSLTADRLTRVLSGTWANGKGLPLPGGYSFSSLARQVDANALLQMEREEMVDTVVASYFDSNKRRGTSLERFNDARLLHAVAKNSDNEGFYLVWGGADENTNFTETVYEQCVMEGEALGLKPVYHVYARFNFFATEGVRFYQIPDRILADFGLDVRNESFNTEDA